MNAHRCARRLLDISRNCQHFQFHRHFRTLSTSYNNSHIYNSPNFNHNYNINKRLFSAPTSQQSNPNINTPKTSELPQNIQNIIDKDAQRNPNAGRTHVPTPTTNTTKKETNLDPNSILPTQRQEQLQAAFDYCVEEVKKEEPQIYQCLQYLKCTDAQRLGVMVLRALHLELSRVRSDANTADAAKIRLQWWISALKDVIDDKYMKNMLKLRNKEKPRIGSVKNAPAMPASEQTQAPKGSNAKDPKVALFEDSVSLGQNTPVLTALSIVRRRYNLRSEWLLKFVQSREHFLSSNAFMSLMELEEYSENTHGLLLNLSMEVMGVAYASSSKFHYKASNHVACFQTIASVLRSMPLAVSNGFMTIPDDIAADHRLWDSEKEVLQGKSTPELERAVTFMCERAYGHLLEARDMAKDLNRPVKSMLLVALPAERYLQTLEKCKFNVFDNKLLQPDLGIGFKTALGWKAARNEF